MSLRVQFSSSDETGIQVSARHVRVKVAGHARRTTLKIEDASTLRTCHAVERATTCSGTNFSSINSQVLIAALLYTHIELPVIDKKKNLVDNC